MEVLIIIYYKVRCLVYNLHCTCIPLRRPIRQFAALEENNGTLLLVRTEGNNWVSYISMNKYSISDMMDCIMDNILHIVMAMPSVM